MHRQARPLVLAAGLLGGMSWVAHLFVDAAPLWWAGAALLALAAGLVGARLAQVPWLAVIAGISTAALFWSLVELARDAGSDPRVAEGVVGACAALLVGVATVLWRPVEGSEPRPHGRHESPRGSGRGHGNHRG